MALLRERTQPCWPQTGFPTTSVWRSAQQEDGVDFVAFAVPRRHLVSRRLEDDPANRGDHHAEEDNGRGIVGDDLVDMANPG